MIDLPPGVDEKLVRTLEFVVAGIVGLDVLLVILILTI